MRYLFVILIFIQTCCAFAAKGNFSLSVSHKEMGVGESFQMTLALENIDADFPEPALPGSLEVLGRSTSSNIVMNFGQGTSRVKKLILSVQANEVGVFTVGPFKVEADGQAYQTQQFELTVTEEAGRKESQSAQGESGEKVFLETDIPRREVWLGETIPVTMKLFYAVQVSGLALADPDLSSFDVDDSMVAKSRQYEENVSGRAYHVVELLRFFTPKQAGDLLIPALQMRMMASLDDDNMGFFGSFYGRRVVIKAPAVPLKVRALPAAPADFSGVISSLKSSVTVTKTDLDVGENATITLRFLGQNSLRDLALPPTWLNAKLESCRLYPDKPSLQVRDLMKPGSEDVKTFSIGLVGSEAAKCSLPPVEFSYFDPKLGKYEKIKLEIPVFTVAGTGESVSRTKREKKEAVGSQGQDIVALKEFSSPIDRDERPSWLFFGLWHLPGTLGLVGFAGFLFWQRKALRVLSPQKRAERAREVFEAFAFSLEEGDLGQTVKQLDEQVRHYIEARIKVRLPEVSMASQTPNETKNLLKKLGYSVQTCDEMEKTLLDLEMMELGACATTRVQVEATLQAAKTYVCRMDGEKI